MNGEPLTRANVKSVADVTIPLQAPDGGPVRGDFTEDRGDPHRVFRELLLERAEWLPESPAMIHLAASATDVRRSGMDVQAALQETGLVKAVFDRPLAANELMGLADALGGAMEQAGTHTLPQYLEDELILNLRQDVASARDADDPLILVSRDPLNLHTELSRTPVFRQPRVLMLHCLEPPETGRGGQTILVSMVDVLAHVTPRQQEILRSLTLSESPNAPPVLRMEGHLEVLCFGDYPWWVVEWKYEGGVTDVTAKDVNAALTATLRGMYEPGNAWGVDWTVGSVLVWDNWRYFHGRTRVRESDHQRHLQRIYLTSRAIEPQAKRKDG